MPGSNLIISTSTSPSLKKCHPISFLQGLPPPSASVNGQFIPSILQLLQLFQLEDDRLLRVAVRRRHLGRRQQGRFRLGRSLGRRQLDLVQCWIHLGRPWRRGERPDGPRPFHDQDSQDRSVAGRSRLKVTSGRSQLLPSSYGSTVFLCFFTTEFGLVHPEGSRNI